MTADDKGSHGSRYFYVDERTTAQLVKPAGIGDATVHLSLWAPEVTPGPAVEPREVITFSMVRAGLLVNTVADLIEKARADA
ncbi:hypothetical protein ACQRWP_23765 [Micromonospora trifolii]|uniref:hypothetical protein n=1 Tax=Micromonospora trifolii TaxID=2911208 RepID=UPI003D2EE332